MSVNRRDFLLFLSAGLTTLAMGSCQNSSKLPKITSSPEPKFPQSLPFKPIKGPLPNALDLVQSTIPVSDNFLAEQIQAYSTYEVTDDLVLPEGFTYDLIATWGDKVGNSRFGYNNDYVSFIATAEDQGFLTVNFEYISANIWLETYEQIIGQSLPLKNLQSLGQNQTINAFGLPKKDPLRQDILKLSQEGLTDLGIGVISVQRQADGRWVRTYSATDRVITGLSGWKNNQYLKATGPAVAIFTKKGQGYNDQLGAKIIGTFANCAGGNNSLGDGIECGGKFPKSGDRNRLSRWYSLSAQ
ncbi:MAG: DUF839 domain-containing protein [Planktothrix sp. GU0601_MAG3]|nr:MAG: DUF839 domain-containing protein [Planktothrix sp. GU0601_MAG3]